MDDIDPRKWIEFLATHKVLLILLVGVLSGIAFTQAIKMTWLTWGDVDKVGRARYRNGCMWLGILSTAAATHYWWMSILGADGTSHGLRIVACTAIGFLAPLIYVLAKGFIAWKYPDFAKRLGDNGHTWPEDKK